MFNKFNRAAEEAMELNVIPVMNLFMVLIPFLLLGAAFFHIGVIPVSTPTHDPHESDVPKTPKTVTANLVLRPDKAQITVASVSLSEDELLALSAEWPAPKGEYDAKAIQGHLLYLKGLYPESNTVIVVPHDGVRYQDLVKVLDRTREFEDGTLDADGNPAFQELFPVTVFSRFVPPSPEDLVPEGAAVDGEGGEDGAAVDEGLDFGEEAAP